MYRDHELTLMFADSEPKALVCLDTLWRDVVEPLPLSVARPAIVVTTRATDMQTPRRSTVFGSAAPVDRARKCRRICWRCSRPTRGGRRRGARAKIHRYRVSRLHLRHDGRAESGDDQPRQCLFQRAAIATWYSLEQGDAILAMAPLFHVTGLVAHMALSWTLAAPLILCFRFEAGVVLDALSSAGRRGRSARSPRSLR